MYRQIQSVSWLVGRVLLSVIFISSGVMKILNWSETAAQMTQKGMVAVQFFLAMATIIEIGAGLGILLGWYTRCSAWTLAAYLIPVTLVFHNFWSYEGAAQQAQMINFMKNLTIFGGLLTLAGCGAGPAAVDGVKVPAVSSAAARTEEYHEPVMR